MQWRDITDLWLYGMSDLIAYKNQKQICICLYQFFLEIEEIIDWLRLIKIKKQQNSPLKNKLKSFFAFIAFLTTSGLDP